MVAVTRSTANSERDGMTRTELLALPVVIDITTVARLASAAPPPTTSRSAANSPRKRLPIAESGSHLDGE